jgi:hypothetical protein
MESRGWTRTSGAVWKYAADLAEEAVNLGFSEVQLDYVRFPDEKRLVSEAVFPLANGRVRRAGDSRAAWVHAIRTARHKRPDDDRCLRADGH